MLSAYIESLNQKAKAGDKDALCLLGIFAKEGTDIPQSDEVALKYFQLAAAKDDLLAQYNLAKMYRFGYGCKVDVALCVYWYEKASEQGYHLAQFELGVLFHDGKLLKRNFQKATYYYELAAIQGHPDSMNNLAWLWINSTDTTKYSAAIDYFKKASAKGLKEAQKNLADCYSNAVVVKKDLTKAYYFYVDAALQGCATSQFNVACHLYHGMGVPQDIEAAVAAYCKAHSLGYSKALAALKQISREDNILSATMALSRLSFQQNSTH